MVHHHDEHWRYLDLPSPTTIQRQLASNHLSYLLRAQHRTVHPVHTDIMRAIHPLPTIDLICPSASASKFVPCNISCGFRNNHQHDHLSVRSGMGSGLSNVCMGSMVDRQRDSSDRLLSPDIHNVRSIILTS